MIRVCCECKKHFGEKAPYEDKSLTHGLCKPCALRLRKEWGLKITPLDYIQIPLQAFNRKITRIRRIVKKFFRL